MLDIRPDSAGNRFRQARIALLRRVVEHVLAGQEICRLVDIGGTTQFWQIWSNALPMARLRVDCINLDPHHADIGAVQHVRLLAGNATDLREIADGAYDVAFSNSVIEHVGLWRAQLAMAGEIKRVARHYLVQTPYFWFPVEPHARAPIIHWLPESLTYRLLLRRSLGFWPRQDSVGGAVELVQSARLLDARQFATLFDDAEIRRERFLGLTKALIALRAPTLT